jgi:peptide chain release factor 2
MNSDMSIDDLAKHVYEACKFLDVKNKQVEISQLEKQMSDPKFWQDSKKAEQTTKKISYLKNTVDVWVSLKKEVDELVELNKLNDAGMKIELISKKNELIAMYKKHEQDLQYSDPYDDHNVVMTIQAGVGGRDAQDWAAMLLRMYSRWAEKNKLKIQMIDKSIGEEGGTKSVTLTIDGQNLYGRLKREHGVHRLVRKSPFNSAGLRETSFAKVEVLPQIEQPEEIKIDDEELKIDVFKASGKGGQSVNTTDSAVRVTHKKTGITVAIQNERSQLQNRETALKILRSKLVKLQLDQHQSEVSNLRGPNQKAAWGNQIRNYVMHPYKLVKDTRSNFETSDIEAILDGDINELIEASVRLKNS